MYLFIVSSLIHVMTLKSLLFILYGKYEYHAYICLNLISPQESQSDIPLFSEEEKKTKLKNLLALT